MGGHNRERARTPATTKSRRIIEWRCEMGARRCVVQVRAIRLIVVFVCCFLSGCGVVHKSHREYKAFQALCNAPDRRFIKRQSVVGGIT